MNTASAAGAPWGVSAPGQAETTSIAESKAGGDLSAPRSPSRCPAAAKHHHLSRSSQASGLSSKRQQRLDQKLGHLPGKGEHVPV